MRIALIVPGVGGVRRDGHALVIPVIQALIERLARRHELLVVALDEEREARYSLLGATVVALGRLPGLTKAGRWVAGLRRLITVLRRERCRFDVLHAFWAGNHASWAVVAGRILRIAVMVSIGGGELVWLPDIGYGGQGGVLRRTKISLILRMADAVSACSRYSLEPLASIRPDALWLPWGVDGKMFDGPVGRAPGPPWRLLHVASLNRVKDQGTLLRAVRLVRNQVSVELDCVGEDTLGGQVQRLAVELGSSVKFHGFKPIDEVAPFYHRAHLYVHSSLFESMAAVVLEAAAAGLPTVGTAVGLVAEMAPEAALAVPVRDPQALAQGILDLLANEQKRSELGRAAQQFARKYDSDWTAGQFEAAYTALRERRSHSSLPQA
ncbi:MAG: glycosyltransferase family 4 protein [Acidobacteriota bacterium]|nr:glycosyltransferase family 4 protein [Acidobacteriota bacterium]